MFRVLPRKFVQVRDLGSGPTSTIKQAKTGVALNHLHSKWIRRWKESFGNGSLHPSKPKPEYTQLGKAHKPFYCLSMFPYPSGVLHLGHQRVYTISDVISRFKRLQGHEVIHPMGWDAFGLPAENAAVERGINPADWTKLNIGKMKLQMEMMLADFDWYREVDTSSPEYYKWTQKIFTLLFKKGLAQRKGAEINWDPVDQTVLANEQVDTNGQSWRSGAQVEKRVLEQWFIGITKYADALNEDLKMLDQWPDKVKAMQKHWIGKSEGAEITFLANEGSEIKVFTSRPDTLFSVQFLALAFDHPLVQRMKDTDAHLAAFIAKCSETEIDLDSKVGYKLPGVKVSLPIDVNGSKSNSFDVPVYVAPYVLGSYGHGAVMGCPAHDTRDADFWKLHNPGAPAIETVGPRETSLVGKDHELFTAKDGVLYDSSVLKNGRTSMGIFNKLTSSQAGMKVISCLEKVDSGKASTQFKIRDWLISRQRYWGAPIPIIHCDDCGPVAVPDKDLPVLLPLVEGQDFGKGNPLGSIDSFVNTHCPSCGSPAKRDTDTMDTFIDSSWYFFRYTDSQNPAEIFDYDKASASIPVDLYIGGVEHAILHLLYLRFISKFLGDCGLWDCQMCNNEPIKRLVTQGMVQGKTYSDPETGRFYKPEEIEHSGSGGPIVKATGATPHVSFEKMSKSKYNGVDPTELNNTYGPDAVRAQILFAAPVSDALNWNEEHIQGIQRWLKKVVLMKDDIVARLNRDFRQSQNADTFENLTINGEAFAKAKLNKYEFKLYNEVCFYVNKIAQSFEHVSMNTVISDYMKLTNYIQKVLREDQNILPNLLMDSYKKLLVSMAPVTPSVAEECWEGISEGVGKQWRSIFWESFPTSQVLVSPFEDYKIMINGKKIGTLERVKSLNGLSEEGVLEVLQGHEIVRDRIKDESNVKVIAKKGVVSIICGAPA